MEAVSVSIRFKDLTEKQKDAVQQRLETRREIYQKLLRREQVEVKVLIIGDRPGPAAPQDPEYHHTPFYSIKHCSGWLNALLEVNNIPEENLLWINAFDTKGQLFDMSYIETVEFDYIVALGGNAEKWCIKNKMYYTKVTHPQYHKRFENKKPYPLIDVLLHLLR